MKNARGQIGFTFSLPSGTRSNAATFPSSELLGYSHASLRDVPINCVGGILQEELNPRRKSSMSDDR
jgi:hypothetical protein